MSCIFLLPLSLSRYVSLGDQGRSSDAARIAMSALAEETGRRTADIDKLTSMRLAVR